MKIQVIQHSNKPEAGQDGILFSPMSSPRALDDYDINIIDLSSKSLWEYSNHITLGHIETLPDLKTLQKMVENKKKSIVVYVFPQNVNYTYDLAFGKTQKTIPLKDMIDGMIENSIAFVMPKKSTLVNLAYERTDTEIGGKKYSADFYLLRPYEVVTQSTRSEKPTTTKNADNVYVTTLAVTNTTEDIKHYIDVLFGNAEKQDMPDWMEDVSFGDDAKQNEIISVCEKEIEDANAKILAARTKLKENAEIKSILYTNGNQLVSVVFKILEKILHCDLSKFIDEKREDFLIKNQNCTYIGEIKGVTSNARYEHISQLELHYRKYLDQLAESGLTENVKQLLIINPFRTKPLTQREPIHSSQVELAVRNGCLIIETNTLLRIYERFCNNEVTSQKCVDVFKSKTGLLCLADFDEDTGSNESH